MTGPGVGYPDYQRSFATSRFFNIPSLGGTITQSTQYGPFPTVNIDSIGVRIFALTGHGRVLLEWFADEALTFFITADSISIRETCKFDQSVVVKGSFLRVTAFNVEPADWTFTLILYETTRSVIAQDGSVENVLFNTLNNAIAIATVETFLLPRVWAGEISWTVSCAASPWSAFLRAIDELGNLTFVDMCLQVTNGAPRTTFLPPCTVEFVFNNQSGIATAYNVAVTARPGMSGF